MSPAASVDGVAAILAMGTATPPNTMSQADFPDMYFRAIDSDHVPPKLKSKFRRICESSMIESRNVHMTEEVIKENKDALGFDSPSLSMRQKIAKTEIPKLGKEASEKAINEWGRPASDITHLVMTTNAGIDMPSADYHLTKLLGLRPSVKRVMIHQPGCHGGVMVLRLAKDLAENNKGARVLAVCVELVTMGIRGMNKTNLSTMLQQILFGEGASAAIVGSQPVPTIERPIFELVSTAQTIIPDSDGVITGNLCEAGIIVSLGEDISKLIANNLEACLTEAFSPLNISDWNSIFWIAHPGGRSILDNIEAKLGLKQEKLMSTRKTLKDYGNISTASVLFVLEETRRKSLENKQATTGEGLDWGVILGFGPGLTIETIVLRSIPFPKSKVCEY